MRGCYKKVMYSCGHEGLLYVSGKSADKQEKIEWAERDGICPACYAKMKREEREESRKEEAQVNGFPELEGSEKQISWANEIRSKFFENLNHAIECVKVTDKIQAQIDRATEMLRTVNTARFWIDNRDNTKNLFKLLDAYDKWCLDTCFSENHPKEESTAEKEAKDESTLVPEQVNFDGTVEVKIDNPKISVTYPIKDRTFSLLLRSLGYVWIREERAHVRVIKKEWRYGTIEDRAAETVNKLLLKGFRVMCLDKDIREKAVKADFKPEQTRWIVGFDNSKLLGICWNRDKGDDFYLDAKRLPGAEWSRDNGAVMVSPKEWREIRDFANINGFSISPGAERRMKEAENNELPVRPESPKEDLQPDKLKEILNKDAEIPKDLMDDD